jgi:hypothetical protein
MKKMLKNFKILLPLLLLQSSLYAQNGNDIDYSKPAIKYEFEKTKNYNKTYSITASDKLNIDNRFGLVEIHTWNKNEVKVDIDIRVSGKTEAWAKSVLSDIEIEDNKSGNQVRFKTLFSEDLDKKEGGSRHQDKYRSKGTSQTIEVNYQVYMPSSNPLNIENEFGATIIPDFTGEVDLSIKFGKIETGNLTNVKNMYVEFSKAKLGNIRGGNLVVKFSTATFSRLAGNVKMNIEFCNKIILPLDNNLNSFEMKGSYSTINLKPAKEFSGAYSINTSFGNFNNRTAMRFDLESEDPNSDKFKFERFFSLKTGNGNIPVKIQVSFTTLIMGETTEEDFKDKNKNKQKLKSRTT